MAFLPRPSPSVNIPSTPAAASTSTRGAALVLLPEDGQDAQGEVEVDEVLGHWPDLSTSDDRQLGSPRPRSGVPLPSHILIFLLIAPSLRLGATFISQSATRSGKTSVLFALGFFILLAWFSSHVWIMMGRYLRKWTIEEVTAEALLGHGTGRRGGIRKKWRRRVVAFSRWGLVAVASLLCSLYLTESVNRLPPIPNASNTSLTRVLYFGGVGLLLSPLLTTQSLGSKRVIGFNILTILVHIVTLGLVIAVYVRSETTTIPPRSDQWMPRVVIDPGLWQTISSISFIPASHIFIYQSYSSHAARPMSLANGPPPRKRPFALLLGFSAIFSFIVLAPLVLSNSPPSSPIQLLQSLAILSGVPTLWVYAIAPRLPAARFQPPLYFIIVLVSTIPSPTLHNIIRQLSILSMVVLSYLVPAIFHVTLHSLRPPLSILLPDEDASSPTSSSSDSDDAGSEADELLRRKERLLQRRRLGKRLGWDLGVWLVLGPVGLAICAWNTGHLFNRW